MTTEIEVGRGTRGRRIGLVIVLLVVAAAALVLTLTGRTADGTADVAPVREVTSFEVGNECSSTTQYCERVVPPVGDRACVSTTQYCERIAARASAGEEGGRSS